VSALEVVLCDADGNLFPSEEPAFEASARVTNRLLEELGVERRYGADELRRTAMGRTFRATAARLAAQHGVALDAERLERYVAAEREEVVAHLSAVLAPDPSVSGPLAQLGERYELALVSSSAIARLDACLTATELDAQFELRVSAEDSLAVPTSKPDPAVYAFALARLGVSAERAVAIEDAVAGVKSAVGAGIAAIGNLHFVAEDERAERADALRAAGACLVAGSWDEIAACLAAPPARV
jgi:HAD superfamily hydrolase (TIGR01509 family)